MRLLTASFKAFLISSAAAVLLSVAAFAQADPNSAQGPDEPMQRRALLELMREQQAAGADVSAKPEERQAYIDVLRALGFYDLAAEQLAWLAQGDPDNAKLMRELGEAWMQAGPIGRDKAFNAYHEALRLNPEDRDAQTLLARLLHREGLYEEAERWYDAALAADNPPVPAALGKAALLARRGAAAEASAMIDALGAAAQPYDVEARMMLRKSLYDFEQRGGWLDDSGENHAAYARLLYRAGRISDASLAARRAVTLVPNDYATWNFIAAMQMQMGQLDAAQQAYGKSLEANPDQPNIDAARKQLINELTLRSQGKTQQ